MATRHISNPSPVQVATFGPTGDSYQPKLLVSAISKVIEENGIEDIPIVVIAIAGKSRRGKSYLLNVMIAYLEHMSKSPDQPFQPYASDLSRMKWAGGNMAVTKGMWLWEKAFTIKKKDKSEVAVLLLDTQGICDGVNSAHEMIDSQIIYITLSMATIYIHNVSRDFQMPEKTVYQFCKSFSEVCGVGNDDQQPLFNSFTLLVRDWVGDEPYGCRPDIFRDEIESAKDDPEASKIMNGIDKLFGSKTAWVFPVPLDALQKGQGKISLAEAGAIFQECAIEFLEALFSPVGEYGGQMHHTVTGRKFVEMMKSLSDRLNNLPTLVDPTAQLKDLFLSKAFHTAKEIYEDRVKTAEDLYDIHEVEALLEIGESSAIENFRNQARKYKADDQAFMGYFDKLSKTIRKDKERRLSSAKNRIRDKGIKDKERLKWEKNSAKTMFEEQLMSLKNLSNIREITENLEKAAKSTIDHFNNEVRKFMPAKSPCYDKFSEVIQMEKQLHLLQAVNRIQESKLKEEILLSREYENAKKMFVDNLNTIQDIENKELVKQAEMSAKDYFGHEAGKCNADVLTVRRFTYQLLEAIEKETMLQKAKRENGKLDKRIKKTEWWLMILVAVLFLILAAVMAMLYQAEKFSSLLDSVPRVAGEL